MGHEYYRETVGIIGGGEEERILKGEEDWSMLHICSESHQTSFEKGGDGCIMEGTNLFKVNSTLYARVELLQWNPLPLLV
jgi:hypothetical protein